jgi:hypothetical protein
MPKRAPFSRRGEQAIEALQKAAVAEALPRADGHDAAEARLERARADQYLKPIGPVSVSEGEVVPQENPADGDAPASRREILDTLERPTTISIGASVDRMNAALGAGVLEPAVDAAASAQASNSLEKMLCHQMAGAHFAAMRLLEQSAERRLPIAEVARLTNAATRLIDVYQRGCLTLQKMKTRGTQRVVVQYQQVNVGDGGQAVVAGRLGGGSRRRGRSGGNAE